MAFFICGFTGSGKTTLLRKLELDPSCKRAIDLDEYIFDLHGEEGDLNLGSYIRRVGFEKFRKIESDCIETLSHILDRNDVVALGGGSLENEENFNAIRANQHYLVWLNMSFDLCMKRVQGDENRPLLEKSRSELAEIYKRRSEVFKKAHIQLCSGDVDAVQSIAALKTLVH